MKPLICFLDIENAPNITYTWGFYEQNVIKVIKPWHLLSCAYKWQGGKCQVIANDRGDPTNDLKLCTQIRTLLDQADVVIAQNGDAFDIPKINTRLLVHKLSPPSPYRTIDTLKVARSTFAFSSNKLNDMGKALDEGEKLAHRGFEMWEKCLVGDRRAWDDMKRYNKQDVELLEKIYLRMRPWIRNHPSFGTYSTNMVCPKCGSDHIQSRGVGANNSGTFTKFQCQKCGGWSRVKKITKSDNLVNA